MINDPPFLSHAEMVSIWRGACAGWIVSAAIFAISLFF